MLVAGSFPLVSLAGPKSPAPSEDLKAAESEYYRIITLPTPEGVMLEAGALCFAGPGKLACATRIGDIWIADGVLAEPPQPKWTQFASGLHEVLGLAYKDGCFYATQRCEVTKIKDEDGDRRADIFETLGDPWAINGDYHEYAFGSKFDRNGDLWVVLCLTGSFRSDNPYSKFRPVEKRRRSAPASDRPAASASMPRAMFSTRTTRARGTARANYSSFCRTNSSGIRTGCAGSTSRRPRTRSPPPACTCQALRRRAAVAFTSRRRRFPSC